MAKGWNRVLGTNDPMARTEMEAIRASARSLGSFTRAGGDLYTSAQPCPLCWGEAFWARSDRAYCGTSVKDTAAIGCDDEVFPRQRTSSLQRRKISEVQVWRRKLARGCEYDAMPGMIRY
ncbi:MAG: nucleoside deaminase [Nitrospira sp.]|nr:nucleoside deaminase [Nitrospira sp.]